MALFVTLFRSSYQGKQTLYSWDTSKNPDGGSWVKSDEVPTREVRKFCKTHNIGYDTTWRGFYGTSIYARNFAGQMHFKLKFNVQIPLEDEWTAMIAAREAYVENFRSKVEAEKQAKLIKEVRINEDQRSVTVVLNNGKELYSVVAANTLAMLPYHKSFFAALQADPVIGEFAQAHGTAQRAA